MYCDEKEEERDQTEYSYEYCDELKTHFSNQICIIQSTLNDVKLWEELNHFGELGVFNRSFLLDLEWLHYVWLSDELFEPERVFDIEERLSRLPFEQAYFHKYPDDFLDTSSNVFSLRNSCVVSPENLPIPTLVPLSGIGPINLKNECLRDMALFKKWRNDRTIVMTDEDQTRIFKHFEYMCYFIINVREELLFDILEMM
jgi:hypothetical protein